MKQTTLLLALLCVMLVAACQPQGFQKNTGMIFGTVYHVTYAYDKDLQKEIEEVLMAVDGEFSMFNEKSTVSHLNRGEEWPQSEMYKSLFQLAQTVNKDTEGAFDITVAPLVNAWGFGFKHEQLPTKEQVDSLLRVRDQLDFSAIAKGFGCDEVARLLDAKGISDYMVEIGGEVVVSGKSPNDTPWRIGVMKPVDDSLHIDGEMQAVLNITDKAMATSGNYRNFYYKDGKKYAHTIDPRTGYPVQLTLLSATVFADECAVADAYATSFMVMGVEKAKEVLARHPELAAYFIYNDEDGNPVVWHSDAVKDWIVE
ncbi:FAD:protein FMN transferase [Prevotella sp. E13-17]|uniref:FAD:protein FMN transferase n=1 Tax=Prevotella sp. E13-17 TaxID=2913616 RepID=UPI00351D4843